MEFRRRYNMYYATLGSYASLDPIGIVTKNCIEVSRWLGTADREIVRQIPGVVSVLLDIEAWRTMILDPYHRLGPGVYLVGAKFGDRGVVCVMDRNQPMVRIIEPERDRLGRQ